MEEGRGGNRKLGEERRRKESKMEGEEREKLYLSPC